MPTFKATHPVTGKTIAVQGDSMPTEAEWDEIFSATQGSASKQEPSFTEKAIGGLETLGTIASGSIAQPLSGLAGIAAGGLEAIGVPNMPYQSAAKAVEAVQSGLTLQPKTQQGQENLLAIGESVIGDVGRRMETVSKGLGDVTYDVTGSPLAASVATAAPALALELVGRGLGRASTKAGFAKDVNKAISESAPDVEAIRQSSRQIYKTLDDAGASISDDSFLNLAAKMERTAADMGYDPDVTPAISGVLKRLDKELGKSHSISDIDTLRKVTQIAAQSNIPAEKAIATSMIDDIDNYFSTLKASDLNRSGKIPPEKVSDLYKQTRDLWGRSRRSELVNDVIENAKLQASGLENGIRIGFRQILKNKKQRQYFSKQELAEMNKVVEGTKGANIAKFIGRFGISEGQATSMLGASVGAGGGAAIGSALTGASGAGVGAIAVPLIGQVSKGLAQRLTLKNARFADDIIRAGKDSRKIAEAYLKYTPKAQQSAQELTELFIANKVPVGELQKLKTSKIPFATDAAIFAIPAIEKAYQEQQDGQNQEQQQPEMIDPEAMLQKQAMDDANMIVDNFGNDLVKTYGVKANPRISGIDLFEVTSHPKEVGMALLGEVYQEKPGYIPVAENYIELAMGKPEYERQIEVVGNILQNSGIIPPDDKEEFIARSVSLGVKPEKAFEIANTIKPVSKKEAQKIAEAIRAKILPEQYQDFAPLLQSIEALA